MKIKNRVISAILIPLISAILLILAGCASGGKGPNDGAFRTAAMPPIYDSCESGSSSSSSSNSSLGDQWTLPGGTEFEMPEEHRNSPYVYEGINSEKKGYWIVKHCDETAPQYKVLCDWFDSGRELEEDTHLAKLHGRYLIAMKPKFGIAGDSVDIKTEDNKVIPCILGDIKGEDGGGDEWAHGQGSVVEFITACADYNEYLSHKNPGNEGCHPEWKKVRWVRCYGSVEADNSSKGNKCKIVSKGNNGTIAEAMVSIAYDESNPSKTQNTTVTCQSNGGSFLATQTYVTIHNQVLSGDKFYASCDRSVCTAVRWAGADDNYPAGGTQAQYDYLKGHSDIWEDVGAYTSLDQLQPGDILITRGNGHTWMFVGKEAMETKFPGSGKDAVGGSYGGWTPKIQGAGGQISEGKYEIFRNKKMQENSKYKGITE